jgi:hypothetical protein
MDSSSSWGNPLVKEKENRVTSRLKGRLSLLVLAFAVVMLIFPATAFALEAGSTDSTTTPASGPTISSDKDDYAPGELVTLNGSAWQAGESVHINVDDDQTKTWARNVDVTADENGNITDSFNLPDWFVATYKVTATGAQSGTVTTSFTDSNPTDLVVNPTSATVQRGASAIYGLTVQMGGNQSNCTTTLSASGLPTGATPSFSNAANPRTGNTNYSATLTVSTTATGMESGRTPLGSDEFTVTVARGSDCQGSGNISKQATLVVNPRAPSGLQATANGSNSINLSWTASGDSNAITKYVVFEGATEVASTANNTTTTASITGLAAQSTHTYTVKARYTANSVNYDSVPSNSATATTAPACTNPAAPTFNHNPDGTNGWYKTIPTVSASSTTSGAVVKYSDAQNGTYSTTAPTLSQGQTTVWAKAFDSTGNCSSAAVSQLYKVDTNAPSIQDLGPDATVGTPNAAGWYKDAVTNKFKASDGVSGLAPNQGLAADGSFSKSSGTAEGAAVKINSGDVFDNAGNKASLDSAGFKIDKTAPSVEQLSAGDLNPTGWRNTDLVHNFKASDGLSGLAANQGLNADGTFTLSTSGNSPDANTPLTASKTVTDVAGNSTATSISAKVDKIKPVISYDGVKAGTLGDDNWFKSAVTAGFKASDALSGLANTNQATFERSSGTAEGSAVKVNSDAVVQDQAGNVADNLDSPAFKIDLTNPKADHSLSALANSNGWHKANVTVTLSATDKDASDLNNGSGVKEISYSVNNGAAQTYTNGISLTTDGVYNIKYTATDNSGRTSAEGSVTVRLDKTKPVITDEGLTPANPDGQNGWYVTEVSNGFKASDGLSGFVGQNDPYPFSKSSGFVAHDPAFKINSGTVTDKAGNESLSIDSAAFKIDMKAPDPPSAIDLLSDTGVNTNDDVTSDRTPEFSVTAEPGSTVELFYQTTSGLVSVDSELANASGVAHLTVPDGKALTDGTYTFVAKATDEAGNVSLVSNDDSLTVKVQRDVTVDGTAPISNATSGQPANAAGWHKANVTVTLNAGDGQGSGVEELVYSSTANSAQQISSTTVPANQLPAQVLINTEGTTTISFHAVDKAGNVESPAKTFTVKLDKTAPQVTSNQPTTSPNANGWYNTDVTNRFTFSDGNGSGLANPAADATIDKATQVEGAAVKVNSGPVSDLAGNTNPGVYSAAFKIDKTKPEITVGLPTTQPNEAGWYKSKVTNNFTADDALSGFAGSVNHLAFTKDSGTQEGASVLISSETVTDLAGNEAVAKNAGPFKIDRTAPATNCGIAPSTWSKVDVSIHCAPTDGLSGLANAGDNSFDLSTSVPEGTETANAATGSRSVADVAGNSTTAGPIIGIKVDKKAPALVSDGPTTSPNGAGWYKTAVTNGFTATDGGSGIAPNGVPSDSFTRSSGTAEGLAVKIFSEPVSDAVGNTNPGIYSAAFQIDLSDPYNVTFQGGPAANGSYDFGSSVPAQPTCTASDDLSGLKSCVVTGYSNAVGNHTMTATATDNAGRTATATRTYTVLAAKATGFYQPVDMNGTLNIVKNGSTVPVKFELFGGATNVEQKVLSAVGSMSASKVSCAAFTGDPTDAIEYLAPTSENTGLRFDLTGDQFIYNWKTPKLPNTCYSLTMTAADNTTKLVAYFKLT